MNQRSDIDRVLEIWMADGPTAIPDRVVDVVAARIGVQHQRRAWPFQRRTNVTTQIKLIAGLAAALVIAVVGYSLLPGTSPPGAPTTAPTAIPSPTPIASASPSTAPSAVAACPEWKTDGCGDGAGILTPGSHATQGFMPALTFSVPEGWVNSGDSSSYFEVFPDTPGNQAEFARSGGFADTVVMGFTQGPYFVCDSFEDNRGTTAAEIVAGMEANEALAMTGVADVEIGGLTGKQFDVWLNPDWTEPCPGDPPGFDLGDLRSRGILLDAPGRGVLVIIVGSLHSADFEPFLTQAMPIVESFEFDLGQ